MLRYRLLLSSGEPTTESVLDHLTRSWGTWLARKGYVEPGDAVEAAQVPGLTRFAAHTMTRSESSEGSARWRLTESLETGRWTSTLTFVRVPEVTRAAIGLTSWVEFTIDSTSDTDDGEDAGPVAPFAVPRLAKYLLDGRSWSDARIPLGEVHDVDRNRVPELVSHLTGPTRRLPAVVFSTPPQGDRAGWDDIVQGVADAARGYASVWRLGHDATDALQARLGSPLSVWGGAVRTYLPRVRLNDPTETGYTTRHRVLGWSKLSSNPEGAAAMLARACRLAVVDASPWTPAPLALTQVPIRITDIPTLLAGAASTAPPPAADLDRTAQLERELATAQRSVDVLRAELEQLRPQAEAALQLASDAEEARAAAIAEAQATAQDNAGNVAELEAANKQIRDLRLALEAAARPDAAAALMERAYPEEQYPRPETFEELLLVLEETPEISFTGDARQARALDRHSNRRAWLSKAWDACLTMIEYARAVDDGYDGLLAQWCDGGAPPGARTLPVGSSKALVPSESEQVKNNRTMAAERLLPVPASVDPSGSTYMWSHIRLGGGGADAPRMHYIESGARVYIGYIGKHLTNTLT